MIKTLIAVWETLISGWFFNTYLSAPHSTAGRMIRTPADIYSFTVTPHYVSGEIPGFDKKHKLTERSKLGAFDKIIVRNTSASDTIDPDIGVSRFRPGADNPGDLDMSVESYEAVTNGALSLYWFNMGGKNIIKSRGSLAEIQTSNRELKIADEYISLTVPYWWKQRFNDADLNVLAGSNDSVFTAIELRHPLSPVNQPVSSGRRKTKIEFSVPDYTDDCKLQITMILIPWRKRFMNLPEFNNQLNICTI